MNCAELGPRAAEIFDDHLSAIQRRTDRVFAVLFPLQWIAAMLCAVYVSPRAGEAGQQFVPPDVWTAVVLGGLLSSIPICTIYALPDRFAARATVAVSQLLYSALLIHLTGGRLETHFHVFGSLAILALYRDSRVFAPALAVICIDQFGRGVLWPQSVFGVSAAAPGIAAEHIGWILFEVVFLVWNCVTTIDDMMASAVAQSELEDAQAAINQLVEQRTDELQQRSFELETEMEKRRVLELQLMQAQKLESIGQLAAGIAHEINTPMQFVHDNIEFLSDCSDKLFTVVETYQRNLHADGPQRPWQERAAEVNRVIEDTRFDYIRNEIPNAIRESREGIQRVIHIVRAMKEFSHPGHEEKVGVDLNNAVCSTMTITRNRWKYAAELELDLDPDLPTLRCVPAEINQVLLNLIVNAADAIVEKIGENSGQKGVIAVRTRRDGEFVVIEVSDSGCGISDEIRNRIFDPFFTTKEVGQGTGQGLAICYNIVVNKHHGVIELDSQMGSGSTFRIKLLKEPPAEAATSGERLAASADLSDSFCLQEGDATAVGG